MGFGKGLIVGGAIAGGVLWYGQPWTALHHPRLASLEYRVEAMFGVPQSPISLQSDPPQPSSNQPPHTGTRQTQSTSQGTVSLSASSQATFLSPTCPSGPGLSQDALKEAVSRAFVEVFGSNSLNPSQQFRASGVMLSGMYILMTNHEADHGIDNWQVKIHPNTKSILYQTNKILPDAGGGSGWLVAGLVWRDPQQDLAILKVGDWETGVAVQRHPGYLPFANPNCLQPGDPVYPMGDLLISTSPESEYLNIATFSSGQVVSTNSPFLEQNAPQVHGLGVHATAYATPGFSGGPVVNRYGQLIGIIAAGARRYFPSGVPSSGWHGETNVWIPPVTYTYPFLRSNGVQASG